jgi:UDP-glucose 4-epimerase
MRILVTGGAGYIGSVAVERLIQRGDEVYVFDNLWRGHRRAVEPDATLIVGDIRDKSAVREAFEQTQPEAVLHFAAATVVPESVKEPALYYAINTSGALGLLEIMRDLGVRNFVFSSTAAVYGSCDRVPIEESAPLDAVSPYGWSKLLVERVLESYVSAYDFRAIALRYFNVAGATSAHGEDHDPETHLIPSALMTVTGAKPPLKIFGSDYETRDGTAIRDYVHVVDLADAHLLALDRLGEVTGAFNLGTKSGFSVYEVIQAVEQVTGKPVPYEVAYRRPGDAATLIADSSRAQQELGWTPCRSTLPEIVGSAWDWMSRNPNGYQK